LLLNITTSATKQNIVSGTAVIVWFFVWWKVVKSGPEQDPHISPEELKYIQDSLGNSPHKVRSWTSVAYNMLKFSLLK
jgi:hypothetical protein